MWHSQLLLTFLSTLCSFRSLSFHFFSFCLGSDKCRLVLPHPVTMCTNKHHVQLKSESQPATSTNSSRASVGFWNFSKELLVGLSTMFTRHCLSPYISNPLDCSSGGMWLACCLMSSPNPGRRTPGQTSHHSCKGNGQQMVFKNGQHYPALLSQRCPALPGMFWHTSPGGKMM